MMGHGQTQLISRWQANLFWCTMYPILVIHWNIFVLMSYMLLNLSSGCRYTPKVTGAWFCRHALCSSLCDATSEFSNIAHNLPLIYMLLHHPLPWVPQGGRQIIKSSLSLVPWALGDIPVWRLVFFVLPFSSKKLLPKERDHMIMEAHLSS